MDEILNKTYSLVMEHLNEIKDKGVIIDENLSFVARESMAFSLAKLAIDLIDSQIVLVDENGDQKEGYNA
jgi:hypothetical protein